jgi:hypothetical protein
MGTAVDGVHDSGVVLLNGDKGVPLPLAPSLGIESCGSDCACSAALSQGTLHMSVAQSGETAHHRSSVATPTAVSIRPSQTVAEW